jgi:Helix-turn-helix domain
MSAQQPFLVASSDGAIAREAGTDEARLARQTYLTVDEAVIYLRFVSRAAIYHWADRQGVPKCRRGRVILFLRRDLDEAVRGHGLHRKAG